MGKVIGIDLGSTLSEVAVIEGGKPVVVVNEEGSSTTPSIINLKENSPKVGGAAKRQMLVAPKETVNLIKRFMGGTYDEVKEAITHVQYDVVNDNGLPRVSINGRKYSPEELSAMILTKMKKVAEDYLGETVTDAVITVPAFFSDAAKSATKQSGELAGLNVLRIISEPTAALLASNIDKKKDGKYLVVDFGGSTTDFSVADVSDNVVEILSSYGDVYLGGSDIDKVVSDYLVSCFKDKTGNDVSGDAMAMSRVIEAAEKAKIELSSSVSTEINLPYITVKDNQPIHLIETLTRAKFEQLIKPIVDKVINCGKVALEKADLNADDLDGVLLVGGSCRIPLIQDELIKNFGDKLIKSTNLDLAVAEGAAKPETTFAFALKTATVATLAHWTKITEQLAADAPAVSAFINAKMLYGLQYKVDRELVVGQGGNSLSGLLNSGNYTDYSSAVTVPTGATLIDFALLIKTKLEELAYAPRYLVLNPADWAALALLKDAQKRYLLGGPATVAEKTLWGLKVITTSAMTSGKFLMADFGLGATIYDRQEVEEQGFVYTRIGER